jgi:DNA-binding beta-propeller fold protein YncE
VIFLIQSLINTTTNTEIDTDGDPSNGITSIPVGNRPFGLGFDPIFKNMYVYNGQGGGTTVSVIDTTTNTPIDIDGDPSNGITPIQLPAGSGPFEFVHDPFHNRMYVTNFNGLSTSVHVIDTTTLAVIDTDGDPSNGITPITVGDSLGDITYDPINRDMYVTVSIGNTVIVIDTYTNTVIDTDGDPSNGITPITVGREPFGIEYDSIHHRMYVCSQIFSSVSVINLC